MAKLAVLCLANSYQYCVIILSMKLDSCSPGGCLTLVAGYLQEIKAIIYHHDVQRDAKPLYGRYAAATCAHAAAYIGQACAFLHMHAR